MKLLFTSWNDELVDNRGINQDKWNDAPSVKLPLQFDTENNIVGFMGWAGIILAKENVDIVDMCTRYMAKVKEESCGKCIPCRVGTAMMAGTLKKIAEGEGAEEDIAHLESVGRFVSSASKCSIGKTSPIPILHALKYFKNEFSALVRDHKKAKNSVRYEANWTAPCHSACPAGMNIPEYVELIKELKHTEALQTIRAASPMAASLGRACFHPCEKKCRRAKDETSVSICKLKRFAWDYEDSHVASKPVNPNKYSRQEKVAIIGAGPSGLSAAYYLALKGYPVTIFEALPMSGGMMNIGIPEYRIPKEVLKRETQYIEEIGVEIKYNTPIGKDLTIPQLQQQGYKAFFISTGAHISNKMRVEGEDDGYAGFIRGIDFLKDCVLTQSYEVKGKNVLVIGGGNVAMDCCRSSVRLEAKEVTVIYRRTKKELPADPHEVHDSEIEGVQYKFLTAPKRIVAKDGKVVGLECLRMELGEADASGRRRPVAVENSEFIVPADIILQAIGQECDLSVLNGVEGIKTTKRGTIAANTDTLQTDVPSVFIGGDVYNGPLTIVNACGDARRAAQSIDQFLNNKPVEISSVEKVNKVFKELGTSPKDEPGKIVPGLERIPMPTIPVEKRVSSFSEVEVGYTLQQAVEEASRCLRCYQIGMVALEKRA